MVSKEDKKEIRRLILNELDHLFSHCVIRADGSISGFDIKEGLKCAKDNLGID